MKSSPAILDNSKNVSRKNLLIALIVTGFLARIFIWSISIGSFDMFHWERLARTVATHGLTEAYRIEPWLNYPPIGAMYGGLIYKVAHQSHRAFAMLFKFPAIVADGISCLLLAKIWQKKGDQITALLAAALFAVNPNAILLSAFHGNTDPLYVMFCIAAFAAAEDDRYPMLAGAMLGVALNIKMFPGILLLPMLMLIRSRRAAIKILAALALFTIPYWWAAIVVGHPFVVHVLKYHPGLAGWGLSDILHFARLAFPASGYLRGVSDRLGETLIRATFATIAFAMLVLRRRGEFDRYRAAALTMAIFAALSPVMAVQYTAIVGGIIFMFDIFAGALWGITCGLFMTVNYFGEWSTRDLPIRFVSSNPHPNLISVLQFLPWMIAIVLAIRWSCPTGSAQIKKHG